MGVSLSESRLLFNLAIWRGPNVIASGKPDEWHENVHIQNDHDGSGVHVFDHAKQLAFEKFDEEDDQAEEPDPIVASHQQVISVSFSVPGIWVKGMSYEPKQGYVVERWLLTNMTREEFDNYDW